MFGIAFDGHPDLEPLLLRRTPSRADPLRKDFVLGRRARHGLAGSRWSPSRRPAGAPDAARYPARRPHRLGHP